MSSASRGRRGSGRRLALAGTLLVSACDDRCVAPPAACEPSYAPMFAEIHRRTLRPRCALGGCHAGPSPVAALDLSDAAAAHGALLDGRVIAGDPACGELVFRLHSPDVDEQMPPGRPLGEGELCTIRAWIAAGAAP